MIHVDIKQMWHGDPPPIVICNGTTPATEECPIYAAVPPTGVKSQLGRTAPGWAVTCDEGWRVSFVANGMYQWAAEWLAEELQGKPFAPGRRP